VATVHDRVNPDGPFGVTAESQDDGFLTPGETPVTFLRVVSNKAASAILNVSMPNKKGHQ
jgi:hypothetical protein